MIGAYRRVLKIEPHNASLHNNLGNVLKELGSLDAVVEHYEASLALDLSNSDAHNNLGAVLQGMDRFDEAISCFRKSLAIRDDSVEALNNLGGTLHVVDRLEEAGNCFRRAFELAPVCRVCDFWLIFVPFGHYDEPEILPYAISLICLIGADVK